MCTLESSQIRIRFSLRIKVLIVFLTTVVAVLLLSNYLYYLSSKNILVQNATDRNRSLTRDMSSQISLSEKGTQYVDTLIGDNLRTASLVAKYALNPNAAKVTNQQLTALAREIGVSDITLLQPRDGDIVGVKSSDPKEINLSTKNWSYLYPAFQHLLTEHNVPATPGFGTVGRNYLTIPFSTANSNTQEINKWGYFDDGSTNYIIVPFVHDTVMKAYNSLTGPEAIVQSIKNSDSRILEITAFNPNAFGNKPILYHANGATWVDVRNSPVMFGTYTYSDKNRDVAAVHQANNQDTPVSFEDVVAGKTVLKTFIPVRTGDVSYVVGFVTDYAVIQNVLNQQIHNAISISLAMLVLVSIVSFFASGYIVKPLSTITRRVEQISEIKFDETEPVPVPVHRNDEIGALAVKVNDMSQNISEYMYSLHESIRSERKFSMSYLGIVSSGLVHELRNPSVALKNLIEMFPATQPLDEKGQKILQHMKMASEHLNSIVSDFADFIRNGKLNLAFSNASDIAKEAVGFMRPITEMNAVDLELLLPSPESPILFVDRDKLRQVLVNLLKNGIDAIDPNATQRFVRLEIQTSNNTVQFEVTDSGHGIPHDRWDTIFTPFATKKGDHGIGLGLALSKFIIHSSGGTIAVVCSDTTGTTIRVGIPISSRTQLE